MGDFLPYIVGGFFLLVAVIFGYLLRGSPDIDRSLGMLSGEIAGMVGFLADSAVRASEDFYKGEEGMGEAKLKHATGELVKMVRHYWLIDLNEGVARTLCRAAYVRWQEEKGDGK